MSDAKTRLGQLERYAGRNSRLYVKAIATYMSDEARRRVGSVFGVLRVESDPRTGDALAARIEDALVRGVAEAMKKPQSASGQEVVFESAVTKVNDSLYRLIEEGRLPLDLDKISGALLSQNGQDVIAAVWGRPAVLLCHPVPGKRTSVYDLLEEEPGTEDYESKDSRRGFSHLISGRIGRADKLFVATEDIRNAVGGDRFAAMLADNDPEPALAALRDVLTAGKSTVTVAMTVADAAGEEAAAPGEAKAAAQRPSETQESIDRLLTTQSKTNDILSPSLLPSLAKGAAAAARGVGSGLAGLFKKKAEAPEGATKEEPQPDQEAAASVSEPPEPAAEAVPAASAADSGAGSGEETLMSLAEIDDLVKHEFEEGAADAPDEIGAEPAPTPEEPPKPAASAEPAAAPPAPAAQPAVAAKEKSRAFLARLKAGTVGLPDRLISGFNGLNPTSRGLLWAIMVLIIVFNYSVSVSAWQKRKEATAAAYDRAVMAIEQEIDSAEASLIYRDEERARRTLEEARAATERLPDRQARQKDIKNQLLTKIAAKFEAVRRAIALGAPEIVASINTDASAPTLAKLAWSGSTVWCAAADGRIFKVALKDGSVSKAGDVPGGRAPGVFTMAGGNLLAGGDGGKLTIIPASGKPAEWPISLDNEAHIADAAVYSSRLYVLDPEHNRILRHDAADKAYGKPQYYLKDNTDVSKAVSLDIDGSVYVLLSDGPIVKLVKGLRNDFSAGQVDPPVAAAKKIRVAADSDYIYVLDSSPARVVVYDKKTGLLAAQYESNDLAGASDFLVDEKNRVLLAAVGNQLLRFALPEIK